MDGDQFKAVMENDEVTVEMIEEIAAEKERASRAANEERARKAKEEAERLAREAAEALNAFAENNEEIDTDTEGVSESENKDNDEADHS